jgi:antibiotic biosynthesis monooxygenase (ABM) superfamily enzyme
LCCTQTTEPNARRSSTHVRDHAGRRVKPGRIGEFEEWVSGITDAISRFPGFLGCEVLKPGGPSETEYHIIFKFERMSDLERWEDSEERRDWCGRVEAFQEGRAHRHVATGLERWFVLPPSRDAPPPARYKLVALTWLAIYPLITAVFFFFGEPLQRLPLSIRTLVVTGIVVPAMLYVVMPIMTPLFERWLYPSESTEAQEGVEEP